MVIFEFLGELLFEFLIYPLFKLAFDIGFFIYTFLFPAPKTKEKISWTYNVILTIIGCLALGTFVFAIILLLVLYL